MAGKAALLAVLGALCWFCVYYITTGRDTLMKWYTGLGGCFYRQQEWAGTFFTEAAKNTGNQYCIAAIALCAAMAIYLLREKKGNTIAAGAPLYNKEDLLPGGILTASATLLWLWGRRQVGPSTDEVFSAVNFAELHPFQTLSYYALPNNHILFNLINNIAFHAAGDKVATGRLISLVCYVGVLLAAYDWLKQATGGKWAAITLALALALQFPVWGFAFQGRGYELVTLCEWSAFLLLCRYLAQPDTRQLQLMAVTCAAAYLCVPTFLYFHAALLLVALAAGKKSDMRFWKYQGFCIAAVFLLYVPCLCFSGLAAITGNKYVLAGESYAALKADIIPMFQNYMDYCFCNPVTGCYAADLALFLLPLCLFLYRGNLMARATGAMYVAMWAVCIALTVKMKIYPIDRALTGQFSITLAAALYTVWLAGQWLAKRYNRPALQWAPVLPFCALLALNYVKKDQIHVVYYLCHFPVNLSYEGLEREGISTIPAGSSMGFSDESFYWYYFARQRGYNTDKCRKAGGEYYIGRTDEGSPQEISDGYTLIKEATGYKIYKRNKGDK